MAREKQILYVMDRKTTVPSSVIKQAMLKVMTELGRKPKKNITVITVN